MPDSGPPAPVPGHRRTRLGCPASGSEDRPRDCKGNEETLGYLVERIGPGPFMFCSDFPHEITMDNCMEEIDEILERKDIRDEHKEAILGGNARRFYRRSEATS